MKIVCVLLACFLAVVVAQDHTGKDAEITKHLAECRKDFGVADKDSDEIEFTDYQSACFSYCMYKKRGLMNEDGTYNKAAMLKDAGSASKKAELEKVIQNCEKKIKPVDGCKLAICLHGEEL